MGNNDTVFKIEIAFYLKSVATGVPRLAIVTFSKLRKPE